MASTLRPAFSRRANRYGTTDSICNTCFVTIAAASKEIELQRAEQRHACDPGLLELWTRLINEIKRDSRQRG